FAELDETQFAPQVFDCVTLIALAAEAAGPTDPVDFQPYLIEVTRDGTECTSFAECRDLLDDGEEIDYNGVSGPLDFTEAGEPEFASIELYGYDDEVALSTIEVVESAPLERACSGTVTPGVRPRPEWPGRAPAAGCGPGLSPVRARVPRYSSMTFGSF